MDERQRIEQLRRELHEHNYRYYVLNQPTIGDQVQGFSIALNCNRGLSKKLASTACPLNENHFAERSLWLLWQDGAVKF